MPNNYYNFSTPFVAGTKVRSDQVNSEYSGLETAFDLLPTTPSSLVTGKSWFGTDVQGATVNEYLITTPDPQSALENGQRVAFFATHTNDGAVTFNVDGLGVVSATDNDGTALAANAIITGQYYEFVYDDTNTRWLRSLASSQSIPGGANTQVQFNDNGSFGGIGNLTWDGATLSLVNTGAAGAFYLQQDEVNEVGLEIYSPNSMEEALVFIAIDGASGEGSALSVDNASTDPNAVGIFSSAAIKVSDNNQFRAGSGNDFTFEHTGVLSLIDNQTGDVLIRNSASGENIVFNVNSTGTPQQTLEIGVLGDAVVALNADGTQRLITTDFGVTIGGYTDSVALYSTEQASTPTPTVAARGTFWVRNDVPNVPMFTDDAGTDWQLNVTTAGNPGGVDTNLQFNNAGAFGGFGSWDGTKLALDTTEKFNINSQAADVVNLTADSGSLQIGNVAGLHIGVDRSTIQAKSNGTTAGTLNINNFGGSVIMGGSTALTGFQVSVPTALFTGDVQIGPATTATALLNRFNDTSGITLTGGTDAASGARITVFGDSRATLANDMAFGAGTDDDWMNWDDSAGTLEISTGIGASKTQSAVFAANAVFQLATSVRFLERADHIETPAATFGELWVRNDSPNVLVFTDDTGVDTVLGAGGGGGGFTVVTETTTSRSAAVGEFILCDDDTAGSLVTITLPAASGNADEQIGVKKLGTTANIRIDGNAAEEIDGTVEYDLTAENESVIIICDGSNWFIT